MTNKTNNSLTPVANQPERPPVRVKLRRVNANLAKAYPPDGENRVWWVKVRQAGYRMRNSKACIMITAESKLENVIAANGAGVNSYILKPFDAKTLRAKIDAALTRGRSRCHSPAAPIASNETSPCLQANADQRR